MMTQLADAMEQESELRAALAELVDTLTPAEHDPIRDPAYGDIVRALGLQIGFGALMSSASYEWHAWLAENGYPLGSEFVSGPCRAVLQSDMKRARAALAALEPIRETITALIARVERAEAALRLLERCSRTIIGGLAPGQSINGDAAHTNSLEAATAEAARTLAALEAS